MTKHLLRRIGLCLTALMMLTIVFQDKLLKECIQQRQYSKG